MTEIFVDRSIDRSQILKKITQVKCVFSLQIYELHNGGSVPIVFHIDLFPLHDLQAMNYDHEIFACLNPVGQILPQESFALEWVFSPLESKTYEVRKEISLFVNYLLT